MNRLLVGLLAVAFVVGSAGGALASGGFVTGDLSAPATAQWGAPVATYAPAPYIPAPCNCSPPVIQNVPTVTNYAPYAPAVTANRPVVVASPVVRTYSPVVAYSPVVNTYSPVVTTYSPVVTSYSPVVTAYSPVVSYSPVVTAPAYPVYYRRTLFGPRVYYAPPAYPYVWP